MFDIKKVSLINEIKEEWLLLEQGKDMTVFQSYNWNLLQERYYRGKSRLYKFLVKYEYWIVYKENTPIIIAPLMLCRTNIHIGKFGLVKGGYFIGKNHYSDYCNLIYKDTDEEGFQFLISHLQKQYHHMAMIFDGLREGTEFENYLKKSYIPQRHLSVYVDIEDSVSGYEAQLSKSTKQNLRTARNRINRENLQYEYCIFSKLEDERLVEQLINIHLKRNLEKNRRNKKLFDTLRKIRQSYLEKHKNIIPLVMKEMEDVWVLVVYINGEIAGYLFGLYDLGTIRIMQNCVNSDYGFYSPVFLAAYDYIIDCINGNFGGKRVDRLDFTSGGETYKYKLHGQEKMLCKYSIQF